MTDHPCKGMSKTQREAFERVAINRHPACGQATLERLLKAGLIELGPDRRRRDGLGNYTIPTFFVPLHIHLQWCEWCSQQPENEL